MVLESWIAIPFGGREWNSIHKSYHTEVNWKRIINRNIRVKTKKPLDENIEERFCNFKVGKDNLVSLLGWIIRVFMFWFSQSMTAFSVSQQYLSSSKNFTYSCNAIYYSLWLFGFCVCLQWMFISIWGEAKDFLGHQNQEPWKEKKNDKLNITIKNLLFGSDH